MRTFILLFLFVYTICTSKMEAPSKVADIYKGLKSKIYKCVLEAEKVSEELKDLAQKNLNADESNPLMFHTIKLTIDDRIAIRDCKKAALKNA